MKTVALKAMQFTAATLSSAALALIIVSATPSGARAGEAEAKDLLKAMSDYLAGQKAISFAYDTNLEVVTKEHQKLLFASSGKIEIEPARQDPRLAVWRVCRCRADLRRKDPDVAQQGQQSLRPSRSARYN